MFAPVRYVGPMHSFKMILGGALVAGSLTGCVINTGGTDTLTSFTSDSNTDNNTETDATAGTESTDGTSTATGTETEGTASATEGTSTTEQAPTTGEPTTSTTEGTTAGTTGGGLCGWSVEDNYYTCNFEGEDPGGTNPIACPENLVEGAPCSDSGLTGQGCCDANGDNWYCGEDEMMMQIVVLNECS